MLSSVVNRAIFFVKNKFVFNWPHDHITTASSITVTANGCTRE